MKVRFHKSLVLLIGLTFSALASAQAPAITAEMAARAMEAAVAEAKANNWKLTILIADAAGVPVLLHRMDEASPRSYEIAMSKAKVVIATGMSSGEYGTKLAAGEIEEVEGGVTFAGGVPVRRNGEVIGAVTASGARGVEDEQVSLVAAAILGN